MALNWHAVDNFADRLYQFICAFEAADENDRLKLRGVDGNPQFS